MEIEKLINKENTKYIINLFKHSSKGILMRFFIAILLICLVIDTLITYTFPAYTLIAGIITFFGLSCKDYIIKQDKKLTDILTDENINAVYFEKEPYFELLKHSEKELLKRFITENKQSVIWTLNDYSLYGNMAYKGIGFIQIVPYPQTNKEPLYIAKISPLYFKVLKKFFG